MRLLLLSILLVSCHSLRHTKSGYRKDKHRVSSDWNYFTLDGIIIHYIPSFGNRSCRSKTTTSISIIQTKDKTIRLLSESFNYKLRIGDSIRIAPLEYPIRLFKKRHQRFILISEGKNGDYSPCRPPKSVSQFPHIRKTAYGQLLPNE
mgnify:CR=1 FL=1